MTGIREAEMTSTTARVNAENITTAYVFCTYQTSTIDLHCRATRPSHTVVLATTPITMASIRANKINLTTLLTPAMGRAFRVRNG